MNFDNNSMHMLSLHNLIWFERDPALREIYQKSLDEDVFRTKGQKRALIFGNNAFYDFIFASQKKLGPDSDGPAYDVVKNGIEMLRQLPIPYRREYKIAPPEKSKNDCLSRSGENQSAVAFTTGERCPDFFNSWYNPYVIENCKKNYRIVLQPNDFLLPYWMGRYYGFISADM